MDMQTRPLNELGVGDIRKGVSTRLFTASDVLESCLSRIAQRDKDIGAFVELDDESRAVAGSGIDIHAPLCGVPFAVKDVIDAAGSHTRMGSALYETYAPPYDAGCVGQVRLAGGIVVGKTATCEFAGTQPAGTRNPRDFGRTPGGSSSGSAAAVADFMVPLAFGTQTGGSVLRPAAFCGIVGFKPTYGFYSISGMKPAAHSFDTVGLFTRSVADIALVHETLMNHSSLILSEPVSAPRIGVFRSHLWDSVGADAAAAFERSIEAFERNGAMLREIGMPEGFATITRQRAVINAFERCRTLAGERRGAAKAMGPLTQRVSETGLTVTGEDYAQARMAVETFREGSDTLLDDMDVLIMPTVPGVAPDGLDDTGDPRLQELWTMLHMPSLSIPTFSAPNGMPLGLQLVGRRFRDVELLRVADWAESALTK